MTTAGANVAITVTPNEPLSAQPTLTVNGRTATFANANAGSYTFNYTVQSTDLGRSADARQQDALRSADQRWIAGDGRGHAAAALRVAGARKGRVELRLGGRPEERRHRHRRRQRGVQIGRASCRERV